MSLYHLKLANSILIDDAELFDGAPVGLQIMGRRLEEEKVIGMMRAITQALQEYVGRS